MNGLNGMLETSLIDPRTLEESVSIFAVERQWVEESRILSSIWDKELR